MNDSHNFGHASFHPEHYHAQVPRGLAQVCPVSVFTYANLHLDSITKILNHLLVLTTMADVFLFLSSFSISYVPTQHLGFNTVLVSFLLSAVSVTVMLIVNNNRISALSVLAPTEFMLGIATGCMMGALVLAFLLCGTYKSAGALCHTVLLEQQQQQQQHQMHGEGGPTTNTTNTTHTTDSSPPSPSSYDTILLETCMSHGSTMTAIWFWSGLVAWFNVVSIMLLITGRYELSVHNPSGSGSYTTVGQTPSDHHSSAPHQTTMPAASSVDFEETFRRQQQQILGSTQAAALQSRAASLFVGDYATIPEVTPGAAGPRSAQSNEDAARNLSV